MCFERQNDRRLLINRRQVVKPKDGESDGICEIVINTNQLLEFILFYFFKDSKRSIIGLFSKDQFCLSILECLRCFS